MSDDIKFFGSKIEQKRNILGLTQKGLAEICSLSDLTIRNIEHGAPGTSIGNWVKVADVLGLSIELNSKKMNHEKGDGL